MCNARIRGALIGVEAVTEEGLKDVYKGFKPGWRRPGETAPAVPRARRARGSDRSSFGLPSDRLDSFEATAALAHAADIDFAQFLTLTPFPGTVDFLKWEKNEAAEVARRGRRPGEPLLADPADQAAEDLLAASGDDGRGDPDRHPARLGPASTRSARSGGRSRCVRSIRYRLAFMLVSKLYRQMYGNTGIATDSARVSRSAAWARWLAIPLKRLFLGRADA